MTQVIGQESYQATLHPLPAGSGIMGGQEKRLVSHKRFLKPLVSQAWGGTVSNQLLVLGQSTPM
jgi:hypothetical protein